MTDNLNKCFKKARDLESQGRKREAARLKARLVRKAASSDYMLAKFGKEE